MCVNAALAFHDPQGPIKSRAPWPVMYRSNINLVPREAVRRDKVQRRSPGDESVRGPRCAVLAQASEKILQRYSHYPIIDFDLNIRTKKKKWKRSRDLFIVRGA